MACDQLWASLSFTIAKYLHHNVGQIKNPIFLSNSILCTLSCVCTFIDQFVEMDDKACVCKIQLIKTTEIRASVDALCRDGTSEISRDPRTKRLQTRRESLARPSKHTNNNF